MPLFVLLASCTGRLSDPSDSSSPSGSAPDDSAPEDPFVPAFSSRDGQIELLPFWVRLERVTSVVGLPESDPVFATLLANRLALGDYDYSSGVKPDRMWSPARMALWAKSLKPVCASSALAALYPDLGSSDGIDAALLASDAWGRDVVPSELGLAEAGLESLEPAARYETVCLSVLSAAEFVAQ
jgi:hypothetical protein